MNQNQYTVGFTILMAGFLPFFSQFGNNFAYAYNFDTTSVSASKRHGYYIQDVSVTPSEFNWEGHKIKIHEAWMEGKKGKRSTSDFMLFIKFEVDKSLTNEHKFWDTEKRRIMLVLPEPLQYDSCCMHLPAKLWPKAVAGGSYGEVSHGICLPKTPLEPLKLIVGTSNDAHPSKPILTDVQLTCTLILGLVPSLVRIEQSRSWCGFEQ